MPRWLIVTLAVVLFVSNVINIGADLAAMGEASALVVGGGKLAFTLGLGAGSLVLQLFMPYHRYASWLKWLTLVCYVTLMFMVRIDWHQVLTGLFMPHVQGAAGVTMVVAILGTTISPNLFFWQASQEVEELDQTEERRPLKHAGHQATSAYDRIRLDTFTGMGVSNLVALCIILGRAATLHAHGKSDIQSAANAARALEPAAGKLAALVFNLGLVGTGLLSMPVFAGSSAYAASDAAGWTASLERQPQHARAFYSVIAAGMAPCHSSPRYRI